MPWRCPACQTQIRRSTIDDGDRPRQGQHYRCHVCRLELVLDPRTNALDIVPIDGVDATPPARLLPLPPSVPSVRKRKRQSKRG